MLLNSEINDRLCCLVVFLYDKMCIAVKFFISRVYFLMQQFKYYTLLCCGSKGQSSHAL